MPYARIPDSGDIQLKQVQRLLDHIQPHIKFLYEVRNELQNNPADDVRKEDQQVALNLLNNLFEKENLEGLLRQIQALKRQKENEGKGHVSAFLRAKPLAEHTIRVRDAFLAIDDFAQSKRALHLPKEYILGFRKKTEDLRAYIFALVQLSTHMVQEAAQYEPAYEEYEKQLASSSNQQRPTSKKNSQRTRQRKKRWFEFWK